MYVSSKDNIHNPLQSPGGEMIYELFGSSAAAGQARGHSLAYVVIPPGKSSSAHSHQESEESYFILKGQARLVIDGLEVFLRPGQAGLIKPFEIHQVFNPGEVDLEFLAVCAPPWRAADSFEKPAEAGSHGQNVDFPELAQAVQEEEALHQQSISELQAERFVAELEKESEKIFWAQEVRAGLGENRARMEALVETWDPPVFALLKQLGKAFRPNGNWILTTKIISAPYNLSHSLYWELEYGGYMVWCWHSVELELDGGYQPLRFRVETKKSELYIETEPTLAALKQALVQVYREGSINDQHRRGKPGLILRTENGMGRKNDWTTTLR